MLFFKESGRLGNQIFQYTALKSLCKENETLVLLGFNELQSTFDNLEAKIINTKTNKLARALYYRLYPKIKLLSEIKIISRLTENQESCQVLLNKGYFKNITFVKESYFQSQSLFNSEVLTHLTIKSELLLPIQEYLYQKTGEMTPVFVHVRRGDYLTWPTKENPAVLPASYYYKCIDIIKNIIANPFFVFVSDDPYYVKDVFADLKNSCIFRGSSLEDFTLMTQCKSGILSASTFAWWGAYFANSAFPEGVFLAPEYWAGHRSRKWMPHEFIKSNFLTYI